MCHENKTVNKKIIRSNQIHCDTDEHRPELFFWLTACIDFLVCLVRFSVYNVGDVGWVENEGKGDERERKEKTKILGKLKKLLTREFNSFSLFQSLSWRASHVFGVHLSTQKQ